MSTGKAQTLVITSAAVVAGVYGYRRYNGKTTTSLTTFATAWGTIFFILSLLAEAAPGLAGAMSLLVMTSDLLANTSGPNGLASLVQQGLAGVNITPTTAAAPVVATTAAASPSTYGGQSIPHGYHRSGNGVAAVPHPTHGTVTPGGQSVQSAATAAGLHYDPSTGQYVP